MNKILTVVMLSQVLLLACTLTSLAQNPVVAGIMRMRYIVSPEVHADNSVSFRFKATDATKVSLHAPFLNEDLPMTKDTAGVWNVTTSPVQPDLYPYCFSVDGILVTDPNNVLISPNEGFKYSLVDIQGDTSPIYAVRDVPHGKITYRFYYSGQLKDTRPLVVYTPPGYDTAGDKKYPVLYLTHGATDTHESWYKVGRANFILDNLIAEHKAAPMIIVMPYDFTDESGKEIIPFVEQNYKVLTSAGNQAFVGFPEKQQTWMAARINLHKQAQLLFK